MEGRLVTQTFDRLLSQETLDDDETSQIRDALKFSEEIFDGLGFCLSEKPDLLSQWRGYADDGQGFSIGFNKTYLEQLAKSKHQTIAGFRIGKVIYEPDEHQATLKLQYEIVKGLIDSGQLKVPKFGLLSSSDEEVQERMDAYKKALKLLYRSAISTFVDAHTLKSKAFSEEAEWRLVSYFSKDLDDHALFRAAGNRLIPYREFKLVPLAEKSITEVYVGPKNITPDFVLNRFLAIHGFPDVAVKRSAATYR